MKYFHSYNDNELVSKRNEGKVNDEVNEKVKHKSSTK